VRKNFEDLADAVGWSPDNLIIDRFGLNYDFIDVNALSWIDNLETASGKRLDDPTHKDFHKDYVQGYLRQFGARKVEANALVVRPEAGRNLCQEAINRYVPPSAIRRYQTRLGAARRQARDAIARPLP
jgi:hypothetical protein